MQIKAFPANYGLEPKELETLLGQGWQCLGVLPLVKHRVGVATLSDPNGGQTQPMLTFVRLEAMVPAKVVAQALMAIHNREMDTSMVIKRLFGVMPSELKRSLRDEPNAAEIESPPATPRS